MLFFIMQINNSDFILGDASNMNGLLLLAIGVNNFVVVSEVNKSEAIESKIAGIEEANIILSAGIIELDEILPVIVIDHHHA